jgi:hypothetical protein
MSLLSETTSYDTKSPVRYNKMVTTIRDTGNQVPESLTLHRSLYLEQCRVNGKEPTDVNLPPLELTNCVGDMTTNPLTRVGFDANCRGEVHISDYHSNSESVRYMYTSRIVAPGRKGFIAKLESMTSQLVWDMVEYIEYISTCTGSWECRGGTGMVRGYPVELMNGLYNHGLAPMAVFTSSAHRPKHSLVKSMSSVRYSSIEPVEVCTGLYGVIHINQLVNMCPPDVKPVPRI